MKVRILQRYRERESLFDDVVRIVIYEEEEYAPDKTVNMRRKQNT